MEALLFGNRTNRTRHTVSIQIVHVFASAGGLWHYLLCAGSDFSIAEFDGNEIGRGRDTTINRNSNLEDEFVNILNAIE